MIGRTLGHYEITAFIGRGGMGEVYRARDARLKRDVALKILRADMALDPARLERFQLEAETVAGLNHPHIVTVFSVEEVDGVHLLTMELIEGQTLDAVLVPDGLPLTKVFEIGIAVADALSAAHEKGIVHRDLKPSNIMIANDGRIKVVDFGLAKLTRPPTIESAETVTFLVTAEGTVIGTVPYMSPEQLRGQVIDHRSDIFSLGVILYQMATGRRPFSGVTSSDVTSSILRDIPEPIDLVKAGLPHHLARIVSHSMEKDTRERAQSALDVRNDLRALRREIEAGVGDITAETPRRSALSRGGSRRRWFGFAVAAIVVAAAVVFLQRSRGPVPAEHMPAADITAVDPHSIAVLPFVNMSSDREQDYFSEGISEELLNLLAKIPGLKVMARTSSFSFKGKDVEIPEIARQLHVAHVLEGSVRKSGDQVRITAQLVHAADGFHLWSQTYDRKLDDIFKIQEEIAADVVKELKVKLLDATPKARTTDPRAYALYLQARQLGREFSAEAFARSDELYGQVLEIDPHYAPAWNGLASNFANESGIGLLSSEDGAARAREAAEKALAIDPDFALAHAGLGWIAMTFDGSLADAAPHFERALELDSTDPSVLGNAASFLESLGRTKEALALNEAVVRRDPVNVSALSNLGNTQRHAGHYDEAIASYRTVLSLSPGRGGAHFGLGESLLVKGDAIGALEQMQAETSELWRMVGLPMAYHALGRGSDSDATLAALIEAYERDAAYNIASVYAFRDESDLSFEWLDRAVAFADPGLSEIVFDNLFANLHSDPRWLPFLRKIGRAPEQLAKIEFKVTPPQGASP